MFAGKQVWEERRWEEGGREKKKESEKDEGDGRKRKVLVEAQVENRQKEGAAESVSHGNRRLVGERERKERKEKGEEDEREDGWRDGQRE